MGNIYCTKCGADAFGKCPKCRTVFMEKWPEELTEEERNCAHNWEYRRTGEKCIYGCGYVSKGE